MTAPEHHRPPRGAVTLDELIAGLQRCRDEEDIDGYTAVRIEPEFGGTEMGPGGALFASGAAVTYPAGTGWASYQPWITLQYRHEHLALAPGITSDSLLLELSNVDRVLGNALLRDGYTVARLQRLGRMATDRESWYDLEELHSVGVIRLLKLVNFFRRRGMEFGWFAAFDEASATWHGLRGQYREPPAGTG